MMHGSHSIARLRCIFSLWVCVCLTRLERGLGSLGGILGSLLGGLGCGGRAVKQRNARTHTVSTQIDTPTVHHTIRS